jgi:predicted nucleic acid-binding protein
VKAVQRLQSELDPGESAAIAFALEVGADLILADERKGGRKRRKWVWRLSDCSVSLAKRNAGG